MKKIVVVGGGVLGTQIAFQVAYSGYDVTIWLRSKDSTSRTKPKLESVRKSYINAINEMDKGGVWSFGISDVKGFNKDNCLEKIESAYKSIKIELDLCEALSGADLVIESMSEDFNAKKDIYLKMKDLLDSKTILVTNSSSILPSKLAKYTGRKDKFLALHFANSIWKNNTAEVMMQKYTDDKYFDEVVNFAKSIHMVALPIKKEKAGYLLNSMLIPFLFSALDLLVNGISDVESIDKAWRLGTGAPEGAFQILDVVGLKTAYEIVKMYTKVPSFIAPYNFKGMEKLLKDYIDKGKLGKSSGEGFYKYE